MSIVRCFRFSVAVVVALTASLVLTANTASFAPKSSENSKAKHDRNYETVQKCSTRQISRFGALFPRHAN
jgi:hypothetical protein